MLGTGSGGNYTAYALKEGFTTRSLAAVEGDKNHNRFLVGTCSLKQKNEIYLLNFHELDNKITLEGLFEHDDEIFNLSSSPYDANLFISSFATERGGYGAAMYDLSVLTEDYLKPDDEEEEGKEKLEWNDTSENKKLKKVLDFGPMESPAHSILWDDANT